jgi:hypothetical protein
LTPDPRGPWTIERRLAALGIAAVAADLGGVLFKSPLGPTGVTVGDWIDALGTFVAIAIYAWIASGLAARGQGPYPALGHLVAALYAMGRGVHLAANSIHDMIDRTGGADPWGLVYLWDERVSHCMVDLARIGFVLLLVSLDRRGESDEGSAGRGGRVALFVGALAYGFTYFASAVEGQTVPLALPFSLALAVWGIGSAARGRALGPTRAFFTGAAVVSLLFFAIWGTWQRGFPEFSHTGLIR